MIYGDPQIHIVRDSTDLIGIRTLILRKNWQPVDSISTPEDVSDQKPEIPEVSEGVMLMGEQTLKNRGHMYTMWTFQGINGDGKSVTFKDRENSIDYGFDPGFAQVSIQAHRDFEKMSEQFSGFPSNDGTTVIWDPKIKASSGGSALNKDGSKESITNPMYGVQSSFSMEGVYRFRYAEKELPSNLFEGVEYIANAEDMPGEPPELKDGKNWLKATPSYQRKGTVYDITEFYWLSRRGGWPAPVYEEGFFDK